MDKKIYWRPYFISSIRFITKNSTFFTKAIEFKKIVLEEKDEFLTCVPFITAQIQGTMLDILASWEINEKIEIDKYGLIKTLQLKEINKKIKRLICIYKKAIIAAYLTIFHRCDILDEEKIQYYIENDIPKDKLLIFKKLHNRIKKMVTHKKIIDNPIFTNNDLFINCDGDFMFGDNLIEFKSSKNNIIKRQTINQLVFYWYLNNHNKRYKIDSLSVFNPLYNSYWTIAVKDINMDLSFLDQWRKEIFKFTKNNREKQNIIRSYYG